MKLRFALTLLFVAAVSGNAQVKPTNANIDFKKLTAPRKLMTIQPLQPSVKLAMVKEILRHRMGAKTVDSSTLAQPITLSVANSVSPLTFSFYNPMVVGGPQKIENPNKLSHVIVVTQEPLKAGLNLRLLTSFDSNWFFSSVEISQLKVGN